jgi:hypothetical protein
VNSSFIISFIISLLITFPVSATKTRLISEAQPMGIAISEALNKYYNNPMGLVTWAHSLSSKDKVKFQKMLAKVKRLPKAIPTKKGLHLVQENLPKIEIDLRHIRKGFSKINGQKYHFLKKMSLTARARKIQRILKLESKQKTTSTIWDIFLPKSHGGYLKVGLLGGAIAGIVGGGFFLKDWYVFNDIQGVLSDTYRYCKTGRIDDKISNDNDDTLTLYAKKEFEEKMERLREIHDNYLSVGAIKEQKAEFCTSTYITDTLWYPVRKHFMPLIHDTVEQYKNSSYDPKKDPDYPDFDKMTVKTVARQTCKELKEIEPKCLEKIRSDVYAHRQKRTRTKTPHSTK